MFKLNYYSHGLSYSVKKKNYEDCYGKLTGCLDSV